MFRQSCFRQGSFRQNCIRQSSFGKRSASLASAGLAMLATVSQTAAGGRALECYEPVHRPALYNTVYE
ncbi:MAG: hypothetical protein E5W56_05565, partial [Mesorhizobium sp.]